MQSKCATRRWKISRGRVLWETGTPFSGCEQTSFRHEEELRRDASEIRSKVNICDFTLDFLPNNSASQPQWCEKNRVLELCLFAVRQGMDDDNEDGGVGGYKKMKCLAALIEAASIRGRNK